MSKTDSNGYAYLTLFSMQFGKATAKIWEKRGAIFP